MPVALGISSLTEVQKSMIIGLAKEHVMLNSKYYPQTEAFVDHAG